ncbi:MAG: domain S-box protein, partial [Paenibacillus sp.]|nr:domain S-box protein [Paenibacillus sp.]
MHYTAMKAMDLSLVFDYKFLLLSTLGGIVLAYYGFRRLCRGIPAMHPGKVSVLLGSAIFVTHHVGMAGVYPLHPLQQGTGAGAAATYRVDNDMLNYTIAAISLILLTIILITWSVDRRKIRAVMKYTHHEMRYGSLFIHHPDLVCELNLEGKITNINPVVHTLTGYDMHEILNRPFQDFVVPGDLKLAEEHFQRAKSGVTHKLEVHVIHREGYPVYFEVTYIPIYLNGDIVGVYVICKDVSQTKRMQREIVESEAKYRYIAENMTDMVSVSDTKGNFLYASPSYQVVLGYQPELLQGKSLFELISEADQEHVYTSYKQLLNSKKPVSMRFKLRQADGRFVNLESVCTPVLDDDGQIERMITVTRNITEQVRMENALKESEARYRQLVELSPQPIFLHQEGEILFVNPAGWKIIGASCEKDLIGSGFYEFFSGEYLPVIKERMQGLSLEEPYLYPRDCQMVRVDGRVIDVKIAGFYDQDMKTHHVIVNDITKRKEIERSLLESEERYRILVESNPEAVFIAKHGKIAYVNPAGLLLLDAESPQELLGSDFMRMIHPNDRELSTQRYKQLLNDTPLDMSERLIQKRDGSYILVEVTSIKILDAGEDAVLVIARDITRRRLAEDQRQKAEQMLKDSQDIYFRLQESLDRFSADLFGAMKKQELESRLIKEVRHILNIENVWVLQKEVSGSGKHSFHSLPIGELITWNDNLVVKIGESVSTTFLLVIEDRSPLLEFQPVRVWLKTISRYVHVLYDNFRVIQDLMSDLERTLTDRQTSPWLLRVIFNLSENERKRLSQDLHDSALQEQIIWYRKLESISNDSAVPDLLRPELAAISE